MRKGLGRHNRRSPGGFNPGFLFSGGIVAGAWYDPSDLSTLFQDSAGTTPVTAVEQVVGLMLDKSRGLVLGPELVTNGDFSSGTTGWMLGAGWSITGGQAVAAVPGGFTDIRGTSNITAANKWYRLTFNITVTAGGVRPFLGGVTYTPTITTSGFYSILIYATSANYVAFTAWGDFTGTIDNVSVKELPGAHATATGTARPTLSARVNLLTKTEDFSDAVWSPANLTISPNAAIAPDGTITADLIYPVSTGGGRRLQRGSVSSTSAIYTWSIRAKYAGIQWLYVFKADGSAIAAWFDVQNGVIGNVATGYTAAIASDANGYYVLTLTTPVGAPAYLGYIGISSANNSDNVTTNGTSGIYIWGADLRVTNDGVNIPPYQRVNTATDYDTAGFPLYLSFAGAQAMSTPANIDFATVTSDGLARRNLLSNPNLFNVAGTTVGLWDTNSGGTTLTANVAVAPDGTTTASLLEDNTGSGNSPWFLQTFSGAVGVTYTFSCYIKAAVGSTIQLWIYDNVGGGTKTSVTATGAWQRFTHTHTLPVGTTLARAGFDLAPIGGVYIWDAQLETGSTATAFQNIGTDKMLVCAGVRKLSDAAIGITTELSANGETNAGAFGTWTPSTGGAASMAFVTRGTTTRYVEYTNSAVAAPFTSVVTGLGNIGQPSGTLRVNGAQVASSTASQGTGNYLSYPLFIGARNLASLFLTGRIYGLVVAGSQYTAGQVSATEQWMNGRTRAF